MANKTVDRHFRFSPEDDERLTQNAKKCGVTKSAYIRLLINGYKPKELPGEDFFTAIRQLTNMSINLNQLTAKANSLEEETPQLNMYNYKLAEIAHELDQVKLEEVTPIEALNILQKIKEKMK